MAISHEHYIIFFLEKKNKITFFNIKKISYDLCESLLEVNISAYIQK